MWTSEANGAFVDLKRALTEAPLLSYPNPDDSFILDTDASSHAVGAVLLQLQEGKECLVAYYRQVLSHPEQQYCTTRKEFLAVVKAVKHFHPYLNDHSFSELTMQPYAGCCLFNFPRGRLLIGWNVSSSMTSELSTTQATDMAMQMPFQGNPASTLVVSTAIGWRQRRSFKEK